MIKKRLYHRIIVILLSVCMIIGLPSGYTGLIRASDSNVLQMTDISGHWAKTQISTWLEKGLIGGYPDKTFKPDNPVSRAEFMALVNRAYRFMKKTAVTFFDVQESDWFFNDVSKAVAAGYITGYGDGSAGPGDNITRQEAAVIISRLLDLPLYESKSAINSFADHGSISDWSREAVNSVVTHGYMVGNLDGTFGPLRHITRAETVVTLSRAVGELFNKEGTYVQTQKIMGNATINTSGVILSDAVIEGNLYLTPGIGDGTVILRNVTVIGKTVIAGGGENSVIFEDCTLNEVYVAREDGKVRVLASGSTTIRIVVVEEGAILDTTQLDDNGGITTVYIFAGEEVELFGDFGTVYIENGNCIVNISGGTIDDLIITDSAAGTVLNISEDSTVNNMQINAPVTVTGQGIIKSAVISSDAQGTTFENPPFSIEGSGAGMPITPVPGTPQAPVTINMPGISGLFVPMTGQIPVGSITQTAQYTGTVIWSPSHSSFEANTVYTATITLTEKPGYTFTGIAENFFTVEGAASVSNNANTGIITAVFPQTAPQVANKSVYDIIFDSSSIIAQQAAPVDITLRAVEIKDEGYERVRVNVSVTSKPASSSVTLIGNYGAGPVDVIALGYWGPVDGHAVSKDYDMTYGLTANFTNPGQYVFSIRLHDMINVTDIMAKTVTVTVVDAPPGGDLLPPSLMVDDTGNYIKTNLDITFTDNAGWRNMITAIKLDGSTLTQGTQYELSAGKISIKTNSIPAMHSADDYLITIEAEGYLPALVTQNVIAGLAGSGTLSDPFLVGSVQELDMLRHYVEVPGLYFSQTADIDLIAISSFEPIGSGGRFTEENRFMGIYDGNNYLIENLTIQDNSMDVKTGAGLFGHTFEAKLLNIRLEGVDIDVPNTSATGALAGFANNTDIVGCVVENSTRVKGFQSVGGLVGHAYACTISNSRADVLVVGESFLSVRTNDIGGFVGNSNNSTITSSSAHGAVSGIHGVGGFAGRADYGTIRGCFADGNVAGQGDSQDIGGFAGFNYYALIEACYYTGAVGGKDDVGGFIGRNIGSIKNSYATGSVIYTGTNAGGFAGRIQKGANMTGLEQPSLIENCYSEVMISGSTARIGAFLGYRDETGVYGSLTMSGNYYNDDKVNVTQGTNAIALSDDNMKKQINFSGWDFINIWGIRENIAAPHLLWQVLSDNADLSQLGVVPGTLLPAFTASTTSYTVQVGSDIETIDVIAGKSDINASMTLYNDYLANSVPTPVNLGPAGTDTAISVNVTAENGVTTKTYTIIVTRAAAQVITYTLTYNAGPNGSITGDVSQTVVQGGNGTQVSAVADSGYEFVGWSDSFFDNPRTDTSVASDITVTAFFSLIGEDAPEFADGYPLVYATTDEGFRIGAQADMISTVYFVVVADGSDAPTSLEVKAMSDYGSVSILRSGIFMTYAPDQPYGSSSMLGLNANTDYDVYVVAETTGGTLQQMPVKLDVKTLEIQYPTFFKIVIGQGLFPRADNIAGRKLDILAGFGNKPGKIYYILVPEGANTPDTQQIIDGFDYGNVTVAANGVIVVSSSGQVYTHTVTGLLPETAYDIYLVAADNSVPMIINPNAEKLTAMTTVADEPAFKPGSPFIYPGRYEDGFKVGAGIDKPGTIYTIIIEKGAPTPTSMEVKAGDDYRSISVLARGSVEAPDTQQLYDIADVRGLEADTEYDVYVVAEDMSSPANIQPLPTKLEVSTLPYYTLSPSLVSGYPQTVSISDTGVRISVKTAQNAYVYYMVVRGTFDIYNEDVVKGMFIHHIYPDWRRECVTGMLQTQRDEEYIIDIQGLDSGTQHTVYITTVNIHNGYYQASLVPVNNMKTFTTTGSAPPSALFSISSKSDTGFYISIGSPDNINTTAYYMVVPDGTIRPKSLQVKAGGEYDGVIPNSSGSINLNSLSGVQVMSLTSASNYNVYVVLENNSNPNLYTTTPYLLNASTTGLQPPVFVQAPTINMLRDTSFILETAINKAGMIYYILVPRNATAPTSSQVKAGVGYTGGAVIKAGSINASTVITYKEQIAGLVPDTGYDLYVAAEADGILQGTPVKRQVQTLPAYVPTFYGSSPTVSQESSSGLTIFGRLNEQGTIHYLIVPAGQSAPAAAQVKDPDLYTGIKSAQGSRVGVIENTTVRIDVTGLLADTSYDLYFVLEGTSGGLSATPVKRSAKTLEEISFLTGPLVTDIRYYRFTIEGRLSRRSTVHYMLVPAGSTQPTALQVKDGVDYASVTVTSSGTRSNIEYFSQSVTGLDPNRTYDMYLVIEESGAELQEPIKAVITTTVMPGIAYSTKAIASPRAYVSTSYTGTRIIVALNRPGVIYVARFAQDIVPTHQEVIDKANSGVYGFTAGITDPDTAYTIIKDWSLITYRLYIVTSDTEVPVNYISPSPQEITVLTE